MLPETLMFTDIIPETSIVMLGGHKISLVISPVSWTSKVEIMILVYGRSLTLTLPKTYKTSKWKVTNVSLILKASKYSLSVFMEILGKFQITGVASKESVFDESLKRKYPKFQSNLPLICICECCEFSPSECLRVYLPLNIKLILWSTQTGHQLNPFRVRDFLRLDISGLLDLFHCLSSKQSFLISCRWSVMSRNRFRRYWRY